MHDMPCEIIRDLLPYYADDLVSDVSRNIIDEHLASCQECRLLLESIEREKNRRLNSMAETDKKEFAHLKQQKKNNIQMFALCITISAVIVALFWIFLHWTAYPIRPDCQNLEKYIGLTTISDDYGFGYASVPVTVHETVKVNDKYCYALFEKNGRLACGRLESDFTGWYKKPYGSFVGDTVNPYFTVKLIGTSQEKYLLFAGRNPELNLTHAKIEVEGLSYVVDVPCQTTFMTIVPVDNSLGYSSRYDTSHDMSEETTASADLAYRDDAFHEWKMAETPMIQVFDASGKDLTSDYIKIDETIYNIDPDLSNLKTCVDSYYENLPSLGNAEAVRRIVCVKKFGSCYYVLTEMNEWINILRLSRSVTGRYCIDHLSQGNPDIFKYEIDWMNYKGKSYVIFGCMDCPGYARSVRFNIYDRLDKKLDVFEIELPEDRPDGYCIAISETDKTFGEAAVPREVIFLP